MRLTQALPQSFKSTSLYRGVRGIALFRQSDRYRHLRQHWRRDQAGIDSYLAGNEEPKYHFGCGGHPLAGWLNTDFFPDDPSILHLDLTKPFPLPDNRAALIFSEHVIEHLPLDGAANMLRECFRVLRPGGKIRLATPDLGRLIAIYQHPDEPSHRAYLEWHHQTWLADAVIATPAVIVNDFVRNWGHLMIYDPQTLTRLMEMAGFIKITPCELQHSDVPQLAGLANDTRMPAGLLALHTMTFEAEKPESKVA